MHTPNLHIDCIERRRRYGPPQPAETGRVVINERDVRLLAFIHLSGGMLTTDIIFRYAQAIGLHRNRAALSRRLKELYHEAGVLERPVQQRNIPYPERYNLVHRVSEQGETLLKARHLFSAYAPRPYGAYAHQMMTACLYASYRISAEEAGIPFAPQHALLEKLKQKVAILVDGARVMPDAVFMLSIDGKHVLIFLEVDRATEPGHSSDDKRKSWGKTIEQYQRIICDKRYKEHYGLPPSCGAQVHVVTIHYGMHQKILRQVERVCPGGCPYILVHASTAFGEGSRPPSYMSMLKVTWDRAGHAPFRFVR
jgi:hypothetical protein